jgi:hypothetical protein
MPADTLIFKRKNGRNEVKIINSMRRGGGHESCKIIVNMNDFRDVALFLSDLKDMWGVPIDKSIAEYQRLKGQNNWPFE